MARLAGESYIAYIAAGAVETVEEKEILILNFFAVGELKKGIAKAAFRTFIGEGDYITQRLDCQPRKWLTGSMEYVITEIYRHEWIKWEQQVLIADEATREAVVRVCGDEESPLKSIRSWQESVKEKRLDKKHEVIEQRIDAKMSEIAELPGDFEDWLHDTGFAKQRYVFYEYKKGRTQQGFCEACGSEVELGKPRHRKEGICPNCCRKVTYVVKGRANGITDTIYVAVLQKVTQGFVMRSCQIRRHFERAKGKYIPQYELREEFRDFFHGKQIESYEFGKFLSTMRFRWCENPNQRGYRRVILYERNLDEVLAGTAYEYCAIKPFAMHQEAFEFSVWGYFSRYLQKPYIEYLVKLRLFNLAAEASGSGFTHELNDDGQNLMEILQIQKRYLPVLQEINATSDQLGVVQVLSGMNHPATADLVNRLFDEFDKHLALDAAKMLACTSLNRMENYLQRKVTGEQSLHDTFILWRDYVNGCVRLGYDLKNDFILFPKRLKRMHDLIAKRVDSFNKKERTKKLGQMSRKLTDYFAQMQEWYGFQDEKFAVIAPGNLNEIVAEGQQLRHCVGGYAESVGDKKTVILFLRKADEPSKPFYTIEIKRGAIQQCRGARNCGMTEDVRSFVETYEKAVLKKAARKVS
jgi:hypothetical protein